MAAISIPLPHGDEASQGLPQPQARVIASAQETRTPPGDTHDTANAIVEAIKQLIKQSSWHGSTNTTVDQPLLTGTLEKETDTNSARSFIARALRYLKTKNTLDSIDQIESMHAAYEPILSLIQGEWSVSAVSAYLESQPKKHRHVLLGCLADLQVELSEPLQHCLVGLLHSNDDRIVNCACLALISGGDEAADLLRDSVTRLHLEKVRAFLNSYCSNV